MKTDLAKVRDELPALELKTSGICVTMEDLARVIELWTGIPAVKINESEFEKLRDLEANLNQKVIGQEEAVHLVS